MSRRYKITILCEDLQQECFVRRFLKRRGWGRYDLVVVRPPAGRGSAEGWVRERFPVELKKHRSKRSHLRIALIAMVDADVREVSQRIGDFDSACRQHGIDRREDDDEVLFVVPKRNIETWFAYLRGETVDETTRYPHYDRESRCYADVDKLDGMCKAGELTGDPPPSLTQCCQDFGTFWGRIQAG